MKNEIVKINNQDVAVIEWNGERVITTSQLADVYETDVNNIQMNYANNKERFKEGTHYFYLEGDVLRIFKKSLPNEIGEPLKFIPKLYLWTHRGASRHCKILDTEKAWEQFDNLEDAYFNPQPSVNTDQLSPELQMFGKLYEVVARQELKQKEQEQKMEQLDNKIDSIKEVVALNPNDWRKDTAKLIYKIALHIGGAEHIKNIREESYKLLEQRMGVSLNTRLTNKRRRMADEGICKSKRDKLNQVDVIADDKKLIEGYLAVVKDMAIKYGISDSEVA